MHSKRHECAEKLDEHIIGRDEFARLLLNENTLTITYSETHVKQEIQRNKKTVILLKKH